MSLQNKEEGLELLDRYKHQALHYLENATDLLGQGELEKGSEMMWGALAEALKAAALVKGYQLNTHADLRRFARQLALDTQQEEIATAFVYGERLHAHSYAGFLDPEDVALHMESLRRALPVLLELAST